MPFGRPKSKYSFSMQIVILRKFGLNCIKMKSKVRVTLDILQSTNLCQGCLIKMIVSCLKNIVEALVEFLESPCINLQRFDFLSYKCEYIVYNNMVFMKIYLINLF